MSTGVRGSITRGCLLWAKLDCAVNSREHAARPYNPDIDILLLCTTNRCRSPMAEVLLRRHLEQSGVEATVSSAGLYPGGSPATDHGVEAMGDRGLDLSKHRSRQLHPVLVDEADLIVGMAREHVREVAVIDSDALSRTFTLKELIRAGEIGGPRGRHEDLTAWLDRVAHGRRRESLMGMGHDASMDVEDPVGRGRDDYETTADELDDLLGRLVALAWPSEVKAST